MALTQVNSGLLDSNAQYTGFKNRIINGAMVIDQRNAGGNSTAVNTYTVDRWAYSASQANKGTWGQNFNGVTPPAGYTNYLGFQTGGSAYSVGASDSFSFYQVIEGYNIADLAWGTANAKTITLSFWVYSSLTGTFGGALRNANSPYYPSYPFTYSIPVANTWTQISITVVGPTSGTWATNNTGGFILFMNLGAGSSNSGTAGAWTNTNYVSATGAVSVVGTASATFYLTGVQLEKGSTATSFDYRPYGTEFSLCQRYYQLGDGYTGSSYSSTNFVGIVKFVTAMRASPTVGETGVNTITYPGNNDYTQSSVNVVINATTRVSTTAVQINLGNFSGITTNVTNIHNVGSGSITLSAEL
jgi:hypothetical protein